MAKLVHLRRSKSEQDLPDMKARKGMLQFLFPQMKESSAVFTHRGFACLSQEIQHY